MSSTRTESWLPPARRPPAGAAAPGPGSRAGSRHGDRPHARSHTRRRNRRRPGSGAASPGRRTGRGRPSGRAGSRTAPSRPGRRRSRSASLRPAPAAASAQSAMGPFYCPLDQTVYIDLSFFQDMQRRFRAGGDFAYAYVIAHEVGHHVENQLGILPRVQERQQEVGERERNQLSVRVELMADCLAGVWAHHSEQRWQIARAGRHRGGDRGRRGDRRRPAAAQGQGRVVPDSFTHGSSAQRVRWLTTGLKSGDRSRAATPSGRAGSKGGAAPAFRPARVPASCRRIHAARPEPPLRAALDRGADRLRHPHARRRPVRRHPGRPAHQGRPPARRPGRSCRTTSRPSGRR